MVPQREFGTLSSESFLISLVERIDKLLLHDGFRTKKMSQEVKSLEFWRSLIAECLSTFFYVFLVCAVNISWTGSLIGHTPNWIVMSLTSGLAMAILTQCFGHISGSHVNPAVTCAFLVTRNITPLRSILYIIAQSGGAIAGAALLYGVSIPGHQGALGIALAHEALGAGQIFGVEFVLTFLIVFTIFATLDINRKSMGNDSITIGSAYMVCSLTGLPASGASFNPARALGPAFVMNKWKHHWVYWIAPITGSMLAGLIYEFIFDSRKSKTLRDVIDDIDKDCNDDHYDEPEVKMTNKTIMGFPLSASSHSNSGSSSSSTHQSNTTGYSSINSNPHHHTLTHHQHHPGLPQYPTSGLNSSPGNTFQHTVLTHDGLYPANQTVTLHPHSNLTSVITGTNNINNNNHNSNSNNNNNSNINTSTNSNNHHAHNSIMNSTNNHVTPLLSSSSSSSSPSAASAPSNYHQFNTSYAGIYGTRNSTLRHLSNRMDYNNVRNEIAPNNISQPGKY